MVRPLRLVSRKNVKEIVLKQNLIVTININITTAAWCNARIVIDMAWVQNLLAPFGCVFGKDALRCFPLLGSLVKQAVLNFSYISIKLKNQIKNFNRKAISWHLRK